MKIFKWILAIFGFLNFGGRGAVIGFIIGAIIDALVKSESEEGSGKSRTNSTSNQSLDNFTRNLVILTAAVMKADGVVVRSELDYVRDFFNKQYSQSIASQAMLYLRDMLKRQLPLRQTSIQLQYSINYSARIQILHYLFGIASAAGEVKLSEVNTIEFISSYLGVHANDFIRVKSSYTHSRSTYQPINQDPHWAYKTLEVQPTATNEEIKRSFRRLAVQYHPDKAIQLGEKQQKTAEEQFKKINHAFDEIKKQRGFK